MTTLLDGLGIVHVGLFCGAVLLLNLTPGPDTAFIVGQSVAHGRRIGLMSVLGISLGCLVHTAAAALGLSAILAASATAFVVIKLVGAGYLTFLGVRMLAASFGAPRPTQAQHATRGGSPRRAFVQGLLTNVLNPKVVLFFVSFFPQFVAPAAAASDGGGWAFACLGGIVVAMSTVYNAAVAWIAGGLTHRIRARPRVKRWLDRSIGAAFIGLGARLAFAER